MTAYQVVGRRVLELAGERVAILDYNNAQQIARDWNTRDETSGFEGHVLRFAVSAELLEKYPVQVAGASRHRELWVPAEELAVFNVAIEGSIELIASFCV